MPDKEKPAAPKVDNRIKADWNNFLSFVEKKGFKGRPELDSHGLGYKVFDEYVKANPTTSLRRETLPQVRQEILNYRNWVLQENKKPIGQKQAQLGKGVTEENFMRHVLENEKAKDPNYPGVHLTSTQFPDSYLKTFVNNQLVNAENKGFASIQKTLK